MSFHILKWVAVATLGWALYRLVTGQEERPAGTGSSAEPAADRDAGRERTERNPGDDLRRIQGIGPAIEGVLNEAGITTWAQLAAADVGALRAILERAGPRYRAHDPATWPAQAAELAAAN